MSEEVYKQRQEYLQSREFLESVEHNSICDDLIEYIESWMDKEELTVRMFAERTGISYHDSTMLLSGNVDLLFKHIGAISLAIGHKFIFTPLTAPKS